MSTVLFIIDPQKDFLDDPKFPGALAVPGGYADMCRLAAHIDNTTPEAIVITLDTHAPWDIAHPMWWVDEKGQNPAPHTDISLEDVQSGKWRCADPALQAYSEFYVAELARLNLYKLHIWPYHCIEGTPGHKLPEVLQEALDRWEARTGKKVMYVYKGRNPKTEHYSGLKAEVVLADDPETELNVGVISFLTQFNRIEYAGEALSHCAGLTLHHLVDHIGNKARDVYVLEDCMSSVATFEETGRQILQSAQAKGVNVVKATTRPAARMAM